MCGAVKGTSRKGSIKSNVLLQGSEGTESGLDIGPGWKLQGSGIPYPGVSTRGRGRKDRKVGRKGKTVERKEGKPDERSQLLT